MLLVFIHMTMFLLKYQYRLPAQNVEKHDHQEQQATQPDLEFAWSVHQLSGEGLEKAEKKSVFREHVLPYMTLNDGKL